MVNAKFRGVVTARLGCVLTAKFRVRESKLRCLKVLKTHGLKMYI